MKDAQLLNFADGNIIATFSNSVLMTITKLQKESKKAIDWFCFNEMVVNPDKFWSIIISRLRKLKESYKLLIENHKRDKIFMSGLSKFCRRQSLKNLLSPLLNTLSLLRISIRSL